MADKSVNNEIKRIKQNVLDTYTALDKQGASLHPKQISDNIDETINSLNLNLSAIILDSVEVLNLDPAEYEIIEIGEATNTQPVKIRTWEDGEV